MIEIIGGPLQVTWVPIKPSATVYVGSLVSVDFSALDEGVIVRPTAVGVSNTTNKDVPMGICLGTNRIDPVFSSTYLAEYVTDEGVTGLRTSTVNYGMVEGPWPHEKRAMVAVGIIGPQTLLRAPIRNAAIGTTVTELTSSAGNANGLTVTTDACDFTPVANLCTIYCREGVNAGQYRITDDTSTTVAAWDVQMLNTTVGVGEKYVRVPLRHHGVSYVVIGDGTVASFISSASTPATNYDIIYVVQLNLEEAGKEFVDFRFDADTFCTARA